MIVVWGREHHGIPDDAWDLLDTVVEFPTVGVGPSLNLTVAGRLALYRLAGLV
jgi:tRNA (guanosine-2'-O-)-methyltransferase